MDLRPRDILDLFTSNDVLENIKISDLTVEIIGYVDRVEPSRVVEKQNQKYNLFKFCLNNGQGKRVQVVAWNEIAVKTEAHIQPNSIIHLDGVQAKTPKWSNFNNGDVSYELLIRSNTVIKNLGKYKINVAEPVSVPLNEVFITPNYFVSLEGYVKTNFANVYDNKLKKEIGCGSITDGIYKVEIHVENFNKDDYLKLKITKGDKVKVEGTVQTEDELSYLVCDNITCITKLNGNISLPLLLKGIQTPKKRELNEF